MQRARFNLEEQVGGLIAHEDRRPRRREIELPAVPEVEEPQRYGLTAQATLAIRARVPFEVVRDTIQPFPTFRRSTSPR